MGLLLITGCERRHVEPDQHQAGTGGVEKEERADRLETPTGAMRQFAGGVYQMGSSGRVQAADGWHEFPEEAPAHEVELASFWLDETEVTNRVFANFIEATGYVTFAERAARREDFPPEARANLPTGSFAQGAMIFSPPPPGVPVQGYRDWWRWDSQACWRRPGGAGTDWHGLEEHPVVCVTYEDATAFARWAKKRLPTEAEWECAARAGQRGLTFCWGNEDDSVRGQRCNNWQGEFPEINERRDGYALSAPVRSFSPNAAGFFDMAGNVWELCEDFYDPSYYAHCPRIKPRGPETWRRREDGAVAAGPPQHVIKGGSFLCHASYCLRYRPAARESQDAQSPTNHVGFRCARD